MACLLATLEEFKVHVGSDDHWISVERGVCEVRHHNIVAKPTDSIFFQSSKRMGSCLFPLPFLSVSLFATDSREK